jgi:DNA-binding NarL/FixJ family response regulator
VIFVFIVAATRVYREGVAAALNQTDKARAVGTASFDDDVPARIAELGADVALVDMAASEGMSTVSSIGLATPDVKIVGISVPERDVVACAEAGVTGFLRPEGSLQELLATIEGAVRGEVYCSPTVAATLFRRVASLAAAQRAERETHLTFRELEIIKLIDQGLSNKEIARRLSIEVATVKNHVHNILEKLDVARRAEVATAFRGLRAGAEI